MHYIGADPLNLVVIPTKVSAWYVHFENIYTTADADKTWRPDEVMN